MEEGLYLRLLGGVNLWWGEDYGNHTFRAGVRATLAVDRGLFYSTPQSPAATAWEGWLGVGMSF